ncbi:CapA family protein [uncultured Subdoligranulum sp.]|uniref:CapA family protein n=1 Tax=uncultured Subdoligranulum sp. TaxID=512298 RepID=UPI00261F769B|nr:CapA family protein [uncultured Subdoligranulum sp.]
MRLRNNEIAACVVIAVGVGGVLIGSLFQDPLMHQASVQASTLLPVPTATPMPTPLPTPAPTPEPTPTVETVRFSATGDNLIHDGIFLQARQRGENGSYDFTEAYEPMRTFYEQFDVNWLNQETLVNDAFEPSGYPLFSTPGDITDALYDIGFRVFSVSNNHSYDKGAEGITSSLEHWAAMPDDVAVAGFYNQETYDDYTYQTVNGITFGYLSYTEYTNGLPTPSESEYRVIYLDERDLISQQIADMRPNCDVLVVSCHWGVEGSHELTDFQTETAQWLADQGVDLIIGTHPHVTQTAQWLTGSGGNTTFVAYSLGNFLNAQSQPDNMVGAVLDITFQKTTQPDGSVSVEMLNPKLHGVVTQYEAGYQDIRVYPYADYTDELGAAHGNFTLSRTQIEEVLSSSIDSEFLTLD